MTNSAATWMSTCHWVYPITPLGNLGTIADLVPHFISSNFKSSALLRYLSWLGLVIFDRMQHDFVWVLLCIA